MTIKKLIIMLILSFCSGSLAFGTYANPKQLQLIATQFLHNHHAEEDITALGMTVQSPHYTAPINIYAGTMSKSQSSAVNYASLFQIGSIGKSFISVILLKLESEPKNHFTIDDSITKFFPEYPYWQRISIRQLLNMTSGIPDYFSDKSILIEYANHPYQHQSTNNWVNRMYVKPLLFKPGTRFNYSNTNYLILGMLIERMSGHPLAEEINHKIIIPLQLKHTYFISHRSNATITQHLVHGYQDQEAFLNYIPRDTDVTHYSLTYLGAAGAIISNSADVSKWIHALFTPGDILTQPQFKKMISLISQTTAQPVNKLSLIDPHAFGLGIGVQYGPHLKTSFYIYQGVTFGYRAIYVYIPTKHTSIVITVNSDFRGKTNHLTDLINQVGAMVI